MKVIIDKSMIAIKAYILCHFFNKYTRDTSIQCAKSDLYYITMQ